MFDVRTYSIDELKSLFSIFSSTSVNAIEDKNIYNYFKSYFNDVNAQTIIVEKNYIDKDYLEDYSGYYSKCFQVYNKKCSRLHFFSASISKEDFLTILLENNKQNQSLQESYLGFIVVKPIPNSFTGKTCLKTYNKETNQKHIRFFSSIRRYTANLFGINLSINTLAFQEQDNSVSACASSALWSLFQGTGMLFQHSIPAPLKITEEAVKKFPSDSTSRLTLPNKGLTVSQIEYSILNFGLKPLNYKLNLNNELTQEKEYHFLKSMIYAYIKGHIPVLMGVQLYKDIDPKEYHAVAITGYALTQEKFNEETPATRLRMKSSKIIKLYVHDDQVGPFARMSFDNIKITVKKENKNLSIESLSTSWYNEKGRAIPVFIIVPLYYKIRIPFEKIYNKTYVFDLDLKAFCENYTDYSEDDQSQVIDIPFLEKLKNVEWEIYLTTVNNL